MDVEIKAGRTLDKNAVLNLGSKQFWLEKLRFALFFREGPSSLCTMTRLTVMFLVGFPLLLHEKHSADAFLPPGPSECLQQKELTPKDCKQALLEMMRSDAGKALGFFEESPVAQMAKMKVEKKDDGWYQWTGAYRFHPEKKSYHLLLSIANPPRPALKPHPKGYLLHLRVHEGSFTMKDGRWIATIPRYRYAVLD